MNKSDDRKKASHVDRLAAWTPPPQPAWLRTLNREGQHLDLGAVVPLTPESLVETARLQTGLDDFGDDHWQEPLEILCQDLNGPAELTAMGRLMTRSDLLLWLQNRLRITELLRIHPEILEQTVDSPMFIVGLPRSGTSILFEVLAQDPRFGVPETWEALFPCPPPEAATYATDARIEQAHQLVTQWTRVVPEFATMHEMGGRIPAECGLIMANSLISDHIASLHQAPGYAAWYAAANLRPAYEDHKTLLKILQWKNPRGRWLLKAPAHQNHLDLLLATYPDACIIQTHRDPIKCMASTTSLLGCLYLMRSDLPFDSTAFANIVQGEATARRLEHVMEQRRAGVIPQARICDSRFHDLMEDPVACVEQIYAHFNMPLTMEARQKMLGYLADKPRGKFGAHRYSVATDELSERRYFRNYQETYNVPNEA